MKYSIVTTTINIPVLLEKYVKDTLLYKRDCFFVVVGDKKTPVGAKKYCDKLARENDVEILFMDVDYQEKYLKDFPELMKHIPYNVIQRRNIGLLYAYQKGADVIITIDDDNFFMDNDFVGLHTVGKTKKMNVISSRTKWLNVCSFLEEEFGREFYHRGFAPEMWFKDESPQVDVQNVNVVVNAGFWLGDPDVDALTRLYYSSKPINATGYKRKSNFALAKDTWSPFNSQNTSLLRDVIPAYFLSPLVGRYDDIWGSYVVKRVADHLGHTISFGLPLVEQKRNLHNYWKDLEKEVDGMNLTMRFVEALSAVNLSGKTYSECYLEIYCSLPKILKIDAIETNHSSYFKDYIEGMGVWIKTFERLNSLE